MKQTLRALPEQRNPKAGVRHNKAAPRAIAAVSLLIGLFGGTGAQANQEPKPLTQAGTAQSALVIDFSKIQSECVQVPGLEVGNQAQWKGCRLVRAGFVGTIGLLDFYYANYCLTKVGKRCAAQAQVLFSNRAYRPEAVARSFRVDPAGTRYGDPLMIGSPEQNLLATTAHHTGKKPVELNYSVWSGAEWASVDTHSWQQELPQQLPSGTMVRLSPHMQPDPTTLTMRLPLFQKGQRGTSIGLRSDAELTFTVEGTRMVVSKMTVTNTDTNTTVLPQTARSAVHSIRLLDIARVQVASLPKDQREIDSLSNTRQRATSIF
jgi:hypothetical protein